MGGVKKKIEERSGQDLWHVLSQADDRCGSVIIEASRCNDCQPDIIVGMMRSRRRRICVRM